MFFFGVQPGSLRALLASGPALLLIAAGLTAPHAYAEGALRQVKYTVFSAQPFNAEIYYPPTDPPTFVDYSHDPDVYSPDVDADVGPVKQWTRDVMLASPPPWA